MLPCCCCIVTNFFFNNQPDALIIHIYSLIKTLHVSGILSAHHQEFSTVHSVMVSFMQVFWVISVYFNIRNTSRSIIHSSRDTLYITHTHTHTHTHTYIYIYIYIYIKVTSHRTLTAGACRKCAVRLYRPSYRSFGKCVRLQAREANGCSALPDPPTPDVTVNRHKPPNTDRTGPDPRLRRTPATNSRTFCTTALLYLLAAGFISHDSKRRALRSRFSPSGSLSLSHTKFRSNNFKRQQFCSLPPAAPTFETERKQLQPVHPHPLTLLLLQRLIFSWAL
jgi:hypothetical protein